MASLYSKGLKRQIYQITSVFIAIMVIVLCTYFTFALYRMSIKHSSTAISLINSQFKQVYEQLLSAQANPKWFDEISETYRYAVAFQNYNQLNKSLKNILSKEKLDNNLRTMTSIAVFSQKGNLLAQAGKIDFKTNLKKLLELKKETFQFYSPLSGFVFVKDIKDENESGVLIARLNNRIFVDILVSFKDEFIKQLGYKNASTFLMSSDGSLTFVHGNQSEEIRDRIVKIHEDNLTENNDLYYYKSELNFPGIQRTLLACTIPKSEVMQATYHVLMITSLGVICIFVLCFSIINFYSNKLIIHPISILTAASEKMASGQLDHEIPIYTKDEMGRLAQTYRKMARSIKSGIDNLEQQVAERTIELQLTNEELQEAEAATARANIAKTRFLANMSHEIRTPLNAIIGFTKIMEKEGTKTKLPTKFYEYLDHISVSGHNLAELINNILDLSKIESGKMNLVKDTVNLHLLLQGIFHVHKAQALNKSVSLNYSIDPNLPTFAKTDRTKVNQILMNLMSNAIKFTSPGKNVHLKAYFENEKIIVEIIDEGIGIPQHKHKSIFEAFEQADDSTTRRFGGTGLGLPIVKQLITLLNGSIELTSKEGEGSCFKVILPFEKSIDSDIKSSEDIENIIFSSNSKVLLVEDNPMNRRFMKELMSLYGLDIMLASSGDEGIKVCMHEKPDLIIMDLHMPDMDGLEASKEILSHSDCSDIPIIMMSADAFEEQKQAAMEAGIQEYILKPIQTTQLIPAMAKYLLVESEEKQPATEIQELTDELKQQIRLELEDLLNIPAYKTSQIINQTNKIISLCEHTDCDYYHLIKKYKDLTINRKDEEAMELLKEFLNG
jgi:signal transduction histidine kinase/CheY-like chemotaxis protein